MENIEKILENYSGGFDLPNSRDYTAEEVDGFGGDGEIPARVMLTEVTNHKQGSVGACTLFGSVNAYNETIKQIKYHLIERGKSGQKQKGVVRVIHKDGIYNSHFNCSKTSEKSKVIFILELVDLLTHKR